MKPPVEIIWFSRLWLATLCISAIVTIATWQELVSGGGIAIEAALIVGLVFSFGLSLVLWSFVMRRRSNVARWIMMILSVLGVAAVFVLPFLTTELGADERPLVWRIVEAVSAVAGLLSNLMLFLPGARRWFDGTRDNLAETFS